MDYFEDLASDLLFIIYISDMPETKSDSEYADDWLMEVERRSFGVPKAIIAFDLNPREARDGLLRFWANRQIQAFW